MAIEIYIMDINGANKRNLSQNPNTDFSFTFTNKRLVIFKNY